MDHQINISAERGCYIVTMDGNFFGSFDTITEATREIDEWLEEATECSTPA